MTKKGFVPIILAAIIAGSVFAVGGGTAGFAYYHSNKLIDSAKEKISQNKYVEASKTYEKAAKWWPSKYRKKLADSAAKVLIDENNYHGAITAIEGSDYDKCITLLESISTDFPKYGYATSMLSQCRDNKNKVSQGQAAVAVTVPESATGQTNQTNGSSSNSQKTSTASNSVSSNSNQSAANNSASSQTNTGSAASNTQASPNNTNGSSSNTGSTETTAPTAPSNPAPPAQTIFGSFNSTSIESIVNSLELVYNDALGDYITPPGGADPVHGTYDYSPIDVDNLYMGVRGGRLYFKVALGGTIALSRETIGSNTIESITYNIGVDSDGDLTEACATEAVFQINIEYHSDGQIWYNSSFGANCTAGEMGTHTAVYATSGHGLAHTYNSGIGKNTLVFSYNLSDLANMIHVGDRLSVYISTEAKSNLWEHYSFDFNELAGEPVWSAWSAKEI